MPSVREGVPGVSIVETRISVWEALAGRAPGQPLAPADPGLWTAVAERVNPAKARPTLRAGIEESDLVSARGVAYTMLRSPDPRQPCYLRLAPDEVALAHLMDGTRTLARLVADFARISGRLAPDQVRRVVADLAGNRMLEELPVDAFRPLRAVRRRPWPIRLGRAMLAFVQGRRMVVANIDPLVGLLYRGGARLLFTRAAAALMVTVAALGLLAFGWQWFAGAQSVFLTGDSYLAGAAVLLGLNVMALACHELGHALAAKHAGRRVPSAGFLVYFGIPSVFVDTTDVWMAGRRARLLTTAAGPGTGLVLAGACALVGLAVPEAAPWCFKLSFAWYVNALFNLNPFLALDGYYLVMDWLEVPNLRARGLAWVAARVRRQPPSWSALDREGRLIALYGMLAIGWLVIALNIAYRVYTDRVSGLILGLWRSGWAARVLLVVVVAALMSPVVYLLAGWLARRARRLRRAWAERAAERDAPRRLDALRASSLRDLPADALSRLAAQSRWVHPRTGAQLVFAGAAQPDVFAVVDGALEARAPGDPPGTIRERVGAGGVVGVGSALSGAPAPLAWHAAGTTLLAVPAAALAGVVGRLDPTGDALATMPGGLGGAMGYDATGHGTTASGAMVAGGAMIAGSAMIAGGAMVAGAPGSTVEAQAVFAEAPALSGLSHEDRLGLASVALPVALAPGATVTLDGPDDVIVIVAGTVATPDGQALGRGTVIGPAGEERPGMVAVTRTPVRLFKLPAVSGLALLLGASPNRLLAESAGQAPGRPPVFGVHPGREYAPLAAPPGPPPPVDDETDGWFERRMRWFLVLVLLLALLLTGGNVLLTPLAWAEMPSDKALLLAERGAATVVVAGTVVQLEQGDKIYVGETDQVRVPARSRALLTYRGGATSVLCPVSEVVLGPLSSTGEPVTPHADLTVRAGLVLTDTASASPAFEPLDASLTAAPGTAANEGPAWFSVAPWGVVVSAGVVTVGGGPVDPVGGSLGCGSGDVVARPSGTPTPRPTAGESPTLTPTPTPTPTVSLTPPPTTSTSTTTTTTTTKPPTTTTKPPTTATTPPNNAPVIKWHYNPGANQDQISQPDFKGTATCSPNYPLYAFPVVIVNDDQDSPSAITVFVHWRGFAEGRARMNWDEGNGINYYYGSIGPMPVPAEPNIGGSLAIWVTATDTKGKTLRIDGVKIGVRPCPDRVG